MHLAPALRCRLSVQQQHRRRQRCPLAPPPRPQRPCWHCCACACSAASPAAPAAAAAGAAALAAVLLALPAAAVAAAAGLAAAASAAVGGPAAAVAGRQLWTHHAPARCACACCRHPTAAESAQVAGTARERLAALASQLACAVAVCEGCKKQLLKWLQWSRVNPVPMQWKHLPQPFSRRIGYSLRWLTKMSSRGTRCLPNSCSTPSAGTNSLRRSLWSITISRVACTRSTAWSGSRAKVTSAAVRNPAHQVHFTDHSPLQVHRFCRQMLSTASPSPDSPLQDPGRQAALQSPLQHAAVQQRPQVPQASAGRQRQPGPPVAAARSHEEQPALLQELMRLWRWYWLRLSSRAEVTPAPQPACGQPGPMLLLLRHALLPPPLA